MPNDIISAADLFTDDPSELFLDVGLPEYNRRLTDKVLAAFNHAYSVGETDIAEQLRVILLETEQKGRQQFPERRDNQAADQADLWVRFVEMRDLYRHVAQDANASSADVSGALDQMKEAYKHWSMS